MKTKLRVSEKGTDDVTIRYTDYFLDMLDRKVQVERQVLGGGLSRTRKVYDDEGRIEEQYFPTLSTITLGTSKHADALYDVVGRLTKLSRPIDDSTSTLQDMTIAYLGLKRQVTDAESKISYKVYDALGRVYRSEDHDNYYQNFDRDAFGNLLKVVDSDSKKLFEAAYDYGVRAFQTSSYEPNSGTWILKPNSFGEIEAYQDANNSGTSNYVTTTFDKLGRQKERVDPANTYTSATTTSWTWGNSATNHNIGKLIEIDTGSHTESYTFDSYGRLSNRSTDADVSYETDYTYYSTTGLLSSFTFPASTSSVRVKLKCGYDHGYTNKITEFTSPSTVYWEATDVDARGNVTEETLASGDDAYRTFDPVTGWVSQIRAGTSNSLQNLVYTWNKVGSLKTRSDINGNLDEEFFYDNLHRLDSSNLDQGQGSSQNLDLEYFLNGNIKKKSDVSGTTEWTYDTDQIHAVKTAGSNAFSYDDNGNQTQRNSDDVEWYSYNLPYRIENGTSKEHKFYYDGSRRRWKEEYTNGVDTETTIYVGRNFEKRSEGSISYYRHQIFADGRLVAVRVRSNDGGGTDVTHSVLTDHLGSTAEVIGGSTISQSHTAFGERRDPGDWESSFPNEPGLAEITQKGFTGHTHLDASSLIHMGGRVLDAELGRFMSPDPYVPNPGRTQSFNRYSYVQNNPLSRTDPTGFWDHDLDGPGWYYKNWYYGFPPGYYAFSLPSGRAKLVRIVQSTGCIAASASGCYGKQLARSVVDATVDEWNRPMQRRSNELSLINSFTAGEVAHEGANIFWPGYDLGTCIYEGGCAWYDWGFGIIGIIPGAKLGTVLAKGLGKADDVVDLVKVARRCCFVEGTLVATEDGLVPIEEIKVGDLVWARDVESGVTELKEVTNLIQRHDREIWVVKLETRSGEIQEFETTDDHPWWIPDTGWVDTRNLENGMVAGDRDGIPPTVVHVAKTDRLDATYNLTVADFETYFVGNSQILVHNCPKLPKRGDKPSNVQHPVSAEESLENAAERLKKNRPGRIEEEFGDAAAKPKVQTTIAGQTKTRQRSKTRVNQTDLENLEGLDDL